MGDAWPRFAALPDGEAASGAVALTGEAGMDGTALADGCKRVADALAQMEE